MKICQLCTVDFTLYHFLLPLMRGLRDAGHEVVGVCADGPFADRVRAEGFRVEPVAMARSMNVYRHVASARTLAGLFRRERFDVVHAHTPVAGLVGRYAAWRAGVPRIVHTAHGFYFHERMPRHRRGAFIALEWLAGRVTHTLLTVSAEDAGTARRYGLIRGPVIEAVGNGADPDRFRPAWSRREREAVRQGLDAPMDRAVILAIGRLVAEKGYPELIAAMRSVDAELWIAGERLESDHAPGIDAALRAAGSDPGLRDRIRFLGYRDDVPDLMRAADIVCLPSHREGMPTAIVEAMMSGLPVVATNIRGSREAVADGETGLLVEVGDGRALAEALNRLAGDPALRKTMGAAGRERAQAHYREKDIVARQVELLGL